MLARALFVRILPCHMLPRAAPADEGQTPPLTLAGQVIGLVQKESKARKDLVLVLRSLRVEVQVRDTLAQALVAGRPTTLLVDYDGLRPAERTRLIEEYGGGKRLGELVLLSDGACRTDFAPLFEAQMLVHLLAGGSLLNVEELLVTLHKRASKDIFGLEKYFPWGVQPVKWWLKSSEDKRKLVRRAEQFATQLGLAKGIASKFALVVDELVTNAVYNAPVDTHGRPLYRSTDRTQPVTLKESQWARVKLCSDGRRLAAAVTDPFGSLSREKLLSTLAKCYRRADDQVNEKPGGAGLGLYEIFEASSSLVVNVRPGERTELIAFLDLGPPGSRSRQSKSMNVFVEDGR
jgi:hypothetical protein